MGAADDLSCEGVADLVRGLGVSTLTLSVATVTSMSEVAETARANGLEATSG